MFYRIKRQKYKDKIYYYLYKEWYDSDAKKKHSKLIGRCDELEKLVEVFEKLKLHGIGLLPSGPGPEQAVSPAHQGAERFYPSQVMAVDMSTQPPAPTATGGKTDVGQKCIEISQPLLEEFVVWLRDEEGTGEKTVRDYTSYLRRALGLRLCSKEDVSKYFRLAGMSKRSYESLRRLLSFVEKRKTGYESLVQQLRKALPRKPRSSADTYVPPDSKILELRDRVKALGEPYYTIYKVLVGTGCRLSEAVHLLKSFDAKRLVKVSEEIYRYHIDLQRKSKNVLVLYLPREVVESIMKFDRYVPRADNVAKAFESCGLAAKYIRKWFRQTLKRLGVDPEVIEFLQGRVSALGIGAKHYTDFIPLADEAYTKTIYPHIKNYL
jgi:intergrase/recombinase